MVWTAIMLVVFIGMAGLVCDIGYVILVRTQLQSAADAAALAAAFKLGPNYAQANVLSTAIATAARNTAAKAPVQLTDNTANAADGDIVIGVFDAEKGTTGTFLPELASPNAVKVVARRSGAAALPLLFAPLFGVNTANVQRTAIASVDPGIRAGVAILDKHAKDALKVSGNPTITVHGGDVVVNSDDHNAAAGNGNPTIDADSLRLMPGVTVPSALADTRVRRMREPLADPLAHLEVPDWQSLKSQSETFPASGEYTPDPSRFMHYYKDGLSLKKELTIMQSGIYVLDGNGLDLQSAGARLSNAPGTGVMLLLVNDGVVKMNGGPALDLTPPEAGDFPPLSETYAGVSIWQTGTKTSDFGGGSDLEVTGILYFPKARVEYGGNSGNFGTQLIVNTLYLYGGATITINYSGVSNPWACLVQ
jgi:Flp pilus assembly protein TadG